ncbi:hypothetical protein [Clostridium sp. AWRP]|uniref:hypothetical protein n=1 Tax=Clostridium sp. AWRP TaxID=2212991 RepID=UPI000FD6E9D9|nr:hypothetical protein [Clostridium sp. AWRP]AZV58939.1 hypothetical protein DMR38_21455 [Clostridium sp. AWRP]
MTDFILDVIKEGLKKLNIYKLIYLLWIIEMYYLIANSIDYFIVNIANGFGINKVFSLPQVAINYNQMVLDKINIWSIVILYLGIVLFFSGIIMSLLKAVPIIKDIDIFIKYSGCGLSLGFGFILIYIIYWIFKFSHLLFIALILIIVIAPKIIMKMHNNRIKF